jgi:hypothetical protein
MENIKDRFCVKVIYSGGGFYNHPCRKPAKVIFEGRPYCGIHDPIKVKKKLEETNARWEKEFAIKKEGWHRQELMNKILGDKSTKELEEMTKEE